jgi:phage shock protein A
MDDVDYTAMRFWFDVIQVVGICALTVYTYVVNRTKANRAAIDRVDEKVDGLALRLNQLESDVRNMPDHDDLGDLHEKVNTIANSMSKIEGALTALSSNMALIHEYLLNEGKRR